jgi:predicted alpha/beta-fold hydrolase
VTLADGDFVDLDWLEAPGAAGAPLLLVLHGLEGSARSHYAQGLVGEAAALGWRAVVLNFRSCSGELNRLPKFYHSGDTADLDAIVRRLHEEAPEVRLGVVGVSLGGNVLLKWLGEQGDAAPPLAGAVAISVPFDLAACARVLDRGFERAVYTRNFLRTMRRKVTLKARIHPDFVDVTAVRRARTFSEYDAVVTAPLNGFADALDYWTRASSAPYLGRVRRPTLLINARDDPFVPPSALPDPATLPSCVEVEFPARGGHVGFIDGRWPWRVGSWAERRAIEFLGPRLEDAEPVC